MNEKLQKEKQSVKVLVLRKRMFFLLTISILLLLCDSHITNHLSMISDSFGAESSFTDGGLITNEEIHKEGLLKWMDGESYLGTKMHPVGSVIHINYTVLASSNSSVFFVPAYRDEASSLWNPAPSNLTLAPGDSFAETYTLMVGASSDHAEFGYYVSVINENSSATIHWWYEILVTGKYSAAGVLMISGTLILISLGVIIRSKRKAIGNRN